MGGIALQNDTKRAKLWLSIPTQSCL